MRAIALLSGGLDSTLAVRLVLDQGIQVEALNFVTPFCTCNRQGRCEAQHVGDQVGIPVRVIPLRDEFFEVLKHPRFGYGSGMNPCLDCRILMFSRAKQRMEEIGADFVFTGEVLGQRPMSQHRRAMGLIDRESGLEGRLLRPLSAKLLEPTIPEKEGIVDRDRLLAIEGRSRKEQMSLATEYGMADYPCPAGGCRLTDPGYARRIRDLVEQKPDFDLSDVNLLRVGRHFRLSSQTKAVVGRNEEENHRLLILAQQGDFLFEVTACGSPLTLLRGGMDEDSLRQAAALTARYSDAPGSDVHVRYGPADATLEEEIQAVPMEEPQLTALRI
jgi:tRNA U34 2-thiouridine synthase MnmA/TrmU